MKKGETIIIPSGTYYWWTRSSEELNALYAKDAATGNTLDSAGEPRLHSRTGTATTTEDTSAIVVRTRGAPWDHWVRKPKGLIEVLAPIGNSARLVCVRADSCMHDARRA